MGLNSHEEISINEFGRRMGVSGTAIRQQIWEKKLNPNGCLKAGVKQKNFGSVPRPYILFDVAYAEWVAAGRTIKNPDYHPHTSGESGKKVQDIKASADKVKLDPTQPNPINGQTANSGNPMGFRSLIFDGMNNFQADAVKGMYEAGLKEIAYFKALGKLAPVERVRFVLFEYGKTIKASLLQIPARVASRMRAAESDREAQDIMYKELEAVLQMLSQGPTQSMDENAKDEFDEDADKFQDHEERGDATSDPNN